MRHTYLIYVMANSFSIYFSIFVIHVFEFQLIINAYNDYKLICILVFFQSPFNIVSVSTIGDELAPTFFYLETVTTNVYNVRVQAANDLATDNNSVYQVCILLDTSVQ